MKLRVRVQRQTSRVELLGEEPRLKELADHVRDTLLPSRGLSLSLNGAEPLRDAGQTLSSCGIVPGDLICVVLTESAASSSSSETLRQQNQQTRQTAAMTSTQSSSSRPADGVSQPEGASAPSWEPMLCSEAQDGHAPLSLELLLHSAEVASPTDAVVVAGHLLMLETGFLPQSGELPSEMPADWRTPAGVYRLQYSHPLCGSSRAVVLCVSMGPLVVINASLKLSGSVDAVRKLCVKPAAYVTDSWPGGGAAAAFRDLNRLSRVFKDQLAYPLIAAARDAMALPVAFGLAALPPELVLRLLRLLDASSLLRLASVCRTLAVSAADPSLWRHLYRRDFSDRDVGRARDTDWKELYKRSHQLRRERRHVTSGPRLPPLLRNPFSPAPFGPFPPSFLGGEYDLNPGLPRPRYDPIGPPPGLGRRAGGRGADARRGFI
ncbi:F-box only protein 7 isoform X2 [Pseudoliparis swirei]|uniref:F-box only protein 7 isoform X2 n=1 Tax=Pseudoliparis swirei TaxID=2059687 RepID=UPI0024BE105A|nr:F-box only protein 7 isoform X2 [Pseudoliparis swirei]